MNRCTFRAHPITILYLLRRWWLAFTAPVARLVIEYFISKEAGKILLSDIVLLSAALLLSVIGWLFTKTVITNQGFTIKRGVFVKVQTKIPFSKILSLSISKSLFLNAIGCEKCRFNTFSKPDNSCVVNLSLNNAKKIYDIFDSKKHNCKLQRDKSIKRYITMPICIFLAGNSAFLLLVKWVRFRTEQLIYLYIVFFILILLYLFYCIYDYKKGFICLGNKILIKNATFLNAKRFCCTKKAVGIIKISQNPFDRRRKTCKLKFAMVGEGGDIATIKYIKTKDVVMQLKNTFGISINV